MNWQRGLWRAWIAVTTLWLLLAFSVARPWEPVRTYWMFYSVIENPELVTRPWIRYDLELAANGDAIEQGCSDGVFSDEQCEALRDAYRRLLFEEATNRFERAEENLIDFLMAAFLPPIGLLAFGLGVAWVLRGFRKAASDC